MLEPSDDYKECPLDSREKIRPEPRYTPVWFVQEKKSLLFSGYTEDRLGKRKMNDLWLRGSDTGQWRQIEHNHSSAGYSPAYTWPGLRYGTMSASDVSMLYIFGGFSDDGDHNDVWRWDWDAEQWQCLSPDIVKDQAPAPRYYGACALHEDGFWIFGGRSRQYPKRNYNDTWRFDILTRKWELVEAQCEENRYDMNALNIGYHAKSASVVVNGRWYVLGGEGLHGHVSDFWCYDFDNQEWNIIQPARSDDPIFW